MRVYLAGPISGDSYAAIVERFLAKVAPLRAAGYEVTHPLLDVGTLRYVLGAAPPADAYPASAGRAIYGRDHWLVAQADILLADLTGAARVSIGTMFELAWAAHLGKHTVVVLPEDGPHRHTFVLEAADVVFTTADAALDYLVALAGMG